MRCSAGSFFAILERSSVIFMICFCANGGLSLIIFARIETAKVLACSVSPFQSRSWSLGRRRSSSVGVFRKMGQMC